MNQLISNAEARDKVIAAIGAARAKGSAGAADGANSKTWKRGRKAVFAYGSGFSIVLVYNDSSFGFDVLRFYGPDGVVCHEEAAGDDRLAEIGGF